MKTPNLRQKGNAFYYDHGGKPRRWEPLGSDKAQALLRWDEIRSGSTQNETVGSLVDSYLASLSGDLSESTKTNYRKLAVLLKRFFGNCPVNQIKRGHVERFIDAYPSKMMARNVVVFYKQVLNKAVAWEIIKVNPLDKMRLKGQNRRRRYIEDQEFIAVRERLTGPYKIALELAYWLCLRVSGVVKLRWDHFKNGELNFHPPKSKNPMRVTITPEIEEILSRARDLPGNVRGFTVICNRFGKPYNKSTVSAAFKKASVALGIPDVRFHDLRRKSASDDPITAQQRLGHEDEKTTRIYTVKPVAVSPLKREIK